MVCQIELINAPGSYALIDDEDFLLISQYKWRAYTRYSKHQHNTYAVTTLSPPNRRKTGQKLQQIRMHRLILNAPTEISVDHVNHNGLDNRKENLRLATQTQNNGNKRMDGRNTTGYRGVYFNKNNGRYYAQIRRKNKSYHLGYFVSAIEAAKAYTQQSKGEPTMSLKQELCQLAIQYAEERDNKRGWSERKGISSTEYETALKRCDKAWKAFMDKLDEVREE